MTCRCVRTLSRSHFEQPVHVRLGEVVSKLLRQAGLDHLPPHAEVGREQLVQQPPVLLRARGETNAPTE